MKRRIIITIDNEKITDAEAMFKVSKVIAGGKISKHKETPQYCFITTFKDGTKVYAREKKNVNTDSFVIW